MTRIQVVIATPALADANNGNWQTARRWQALLSRRHDARIVREWPDEKARIHPAHDQVLLALHARRSAPSVAAWAEQRASRGLGVVLTGTDLYRDIARTPAPGTHWRWPARWWCCRSARSIRCLQPTRPKPA